ncbi:MAG: hypothetical protein RL095_1245 [Verrucomicrobiota bacterium]|jgi:D-psicose/D-tagatose/L-ribulose 3-epimerase
MKLGFNLLIWTGHVTEEHYQQIIKIKKAGFDGVEVPILSGDVAHYRQLGVFLRNEGLACTAVTIIPDEARSPVSPEAARRRAALDYLRHTADCAAAMGAELLIGPYHSPLGVFTGVGATATEKAHCAEVHRALAEHAQQQHLGLAMEWLNRFESYFCTTMAEAADYVKLVDHPNFSSMFDSFHANIEEKDPATAIRRHIGAIRHFHVSENDRGTPGKGQIDFLPQFQALREGGYDQWLTIEAFGRALPDLAAATRVWRDFFPAPEEVYLEGGPFVRNLWAEAAAPQLHSV